MQVVEEIVNILGAPRAVLMIIGMLENIERNKWDTAPDGAVMVLIDQNVQQTAAVKLVQCENRPTRQFGCHGRRLEILFPFLDTAEFLLDRRDNFRAFRGITVATENFPVNIVKKGATVIPGQPALVFAKIGPVAVGRRAIGIFQILLDLV